MPPRHPGPSHPSIRTEGIVLRRRVPIGRIAPLRPGSPPKRRVPVRKERSRPRRGPARNPAYLAWIRTLECAVCARSGCRPAMVEAAHTNILGPRGLNQKASDYSAIPLCAAHHRENRDSYHALGESAFLSTHGIDLQELVLRLQARFWQNESAHKNVWGPAWNRPPRGLVQ